MAAGAPLDWMARTELLTPAPVVFMKAQGGPWVPPLCILTDSPDCHRPALLSLRRFFHHKHKAICWDLFW